MKIQDLPGKRQYVAKWRHVVEIARRTPAAPIQCLTWYERPAEWVRRDFVSALHQRINSRGGITELTLRERDDHRVSRVLRTRYTSECRWCGMPIPYTTVPHQFCSAECRHCYYH